jgi:FKBP-type peptidyl-prolyl cis-trans isomerase
MVDSSAVPAATDAPYEVSSTFDLTPDGGLKKTLLTLGEGSAEDTPQPGDEVICHYVGTLTDGKKFDSSRKYRAERVLSCIASFTAVPSF